MRGIKMKIHINFIILTIIATALLIGCSGQGGNPVTTDTETQNPVAQADEPSRVLWGMWDFVFDTENLTAYPVPIRSAEAHANVTNLILPPACYDCLKLKVNSYNPGTKVIDVDVTLNNKYNISGYDVRGIVFTDDFSNMLLNPDDWTGLWDKTGGDTINPFKAFAKGEPNRIFKGLFSHTETYNIHLPNAAKLTYAVDASFPGNCAEPYEIGNFTQEPVYAALNSSGIVSVDIHDWQGDVSEVGIGIPDISATPGQMSHIGGNLWVYQAVNSLNAPVGSYTATITAKSTGSGSTALYDRVTLVVSEPLVPSVTGIDPSSEYAASKIVATITGTQFQGPDAHVTLTKSGAPDIEADHVAVLSDTAITCAIALPSDAAYGTYDVNVTNDSGLDASGAGLFNLMELVPGTLADVTPRYLNANPNDVVVSNGYLYTAADYGFNTYSLADPENPVWTDTNETDTWPHGVYVHDGYGYLISQPYGIYIYDLSDPAHPVFVSKVEAPGSDSMVVKDGYAYMGGGFIFAAKLIVIDIDPPETASVVAEVIDGTFEYLGDCDIRGNYVYSCGAYGNFHVFDISDPENAFLDHTLDLGVTFQDLEIQGDYAYCRDSGYGIRIMDLSTLGAETIVKSIPMPGTFTRGTSIDGNYLYVTDREALNIVDISEPLTSQIIGSFALGETTSLLDIANGYAYICDYYGMIVMDVDPPESPQWKYQQSVASWTTGLDVVGDMAYVVQSDYGLRIFDITNPEQSTLVKSVPIDGGLSHVAASGGYAYVGMLENYSVAVIDVDPPDNAHIVKILPMPAPPQDVKVRDNLLYAACVYYGTVIMDVSVPESAFLVKAVSSGQATDIEIKGGYAYVVDDWNGIAQIDISVPGASHMTGYVDVNQDNDIAVSGGYAYAGCGSDGFTICDIDPFETASVIYNFSPLDWPLAVVVSGGYAYVGGQLSYGMEIIDVDPPTSASTIDYIQVPGQTSCICLNGGYAYTTGSGLRVIKLN
jgi:hypothetical protein